MDETDICDFSNSNLDIITKNNNLIDNNTNNDMIIQIQKEVKKK